MWDDSDHPKQTKEATMNMDQLREFFGWCTVVNFGLLMVYTVAILGAGRWIAGMHGRLFHLPEGELLKAYYHYLAVYKLLVLALNFAPWLALVIMERG
jgi:hypothetical protein